MSPRKGAGHARRSDEAAAQDGDHSGKLITSEPKHPAEPTRAEITGDHTATACGITVKARAPVLALCRRLVEAGHDPDHPLHAYRGTVLCLRIRSIGKAAKLTVKEDSDGPRFVPHQDAPARRPAASPIRQNGQAAR
jgi:hypothetical protein